MVAGRIASRAGIRRADAPELLAEHAVNNSIHLGTQPLSWDQTCGEVGSDALKAAVVKVKTKWRGSPLKKPDEVRGRPFSRSICSTHDELMIS